MGSAGLLRLLAALLGAAVLVAPPCAGLQATRARASSKGPLADDWFEASSEAESTLDGSLNQEVQGDRDGFEYRPETPGGDDPRKLRHGRDEIIEAADGNSADFYQESPSGAGQEAWQTYYPAHKATGAWSMTAGGSLTEDVQHTVPHGTGLLRPGWFDNSVLNVDTYGRGRLPDVGSPARNLFWQERAVNTTLECDTVGCTGVSMMQAFDPAKEEVRHCKLSVFLHPTDFDDQYSGERLTWVRVNGQPRGGGNRGRGPPHSDRTPSRLSQWTMSSATRFSPADIVSSLEHPSNKTSCPCPG
mmetsp:Transcript_124435/g.387426  ORF Transcript_124435/g.387426 Transcript_124435/m.387426 type:complete len:302 (-) Transcript_124435:867-1772(-)